MKEKWKSVVGYEGLYEVSDLGRVKSLKRMAKNGYGWRPVRERMLRLVDDGGGYRTVHLGDGHEKKVILVHRIVLSAFLGVAPPGLESRHLDGNPSNNQLENLTWGTKSENELDKARHGTSNRGERNYCTKLTEQNVIKIRSLLQHSELSEREIGKMFGVTRGCVSNIKWRTSWAWLN